MSFQKGDKVKLKSGGPEMAVIRIIGETDGNKMDEVMKMRGFDDDDVLCEFTNQKGKPERSAFKAAMVIPADEEWIIGGGEEPDKESDEDNTAEEEEEDLNLDDFDF